MYLPVARQSAKPHFRATGQVVTCRTFAGLAACNYLAVRRHLTATFSSLQTSPERSSTPFLSDPAIPRHISMPSTPDGLKGSDKSWCRIEPIIYAPGSVDEIVTTVSSAVKDTLLGKPSHMISDPNHEKAEELLRGIHDKEVAALFGFKATALSNAPFRLVQRIIAGSDPGNLQTGESFIALSYCWLSNEWKKKADASSTRQSKVPISLALFEAILAERASEGEGIWIDQLCINQTDKQEKAMAVGAMDVVYQRARLVAVVLEDVVLDQLDESTLRGLMKTYDSGETWVHSEKMSSNRRLTMLTWKILSARWFTRAWCGHEFLVSSNHLFLLQTESDRVVKMTTPFLLDLILLQSAYLSAAEGDEFAALSYAHGRQRRMVHRYASPQFQTKWSVGKQQDQLYTPSFTRAFSEVFGFDATFVADKLSIVLNVLQCGLYFKGTDSMTHDQCCYIFHHIALSARDPTIFSTSGSRLERAAWMRSPRDTDVNEPLFMGSKHLRLEHTPPFSDEGIELDLVVIGTSRTVNRPTSRHKVWANRVLKRCVEHASAFPMKFTILINGLRLDSEDDMAEDSPYTQRDFYLDLLACLHECPGGIDWLVRSWEQWSPHLFDEATEERIRRAMSLGYEGGAQLTPAQVDDMVDILNLLDDIHFPLHIADGRPAWLQTGSSDAIVFLCPPGNRTGPEYSVAVPKMLLSAKYNMMRRLWYLSAKDLHGSQALTDSDRKHGGWDVVGKSCFFGHVEPGELQGSGTVMRAQMICS
ncbi:heterokaryon incompatibility protein-domain-containing protein [Podospora appendiculata]|uniref:Heterokaryon incompatibility protein-domain-containing protein n=1 Tax=Podospora appendiculata TaxID=314037 RepID=A0AAE0XH27_9PEZI|nr:heterokaryon incompatibility protein-domain-containing protein [Podospora appendiculata]